MKFLPYFSIIAISFVSTYINLHTFIQVTVYALLTYYTAALTLDSNSSTPGTSNKITKSDALKFPIVASVVLLGAYIILKLIKSDYTNILITLYFALISLELIYEVLYKTIFSSKTQNFLSTNFLTFKVPENVLINYLLSPDIISLNLAKLISFLISSITVFYYVKTKHFILNNIIAFILSVKSFEEMHLDSFSNSFIMLVALFLYDVFWVYGTDVMVTVATKLDAPIKFLLPRIAEGKVKLGLLGLGDIVIPGLHIMLMKRFDRKVGSKGAYYYSSLVGYVAGMAACSIVLYVWEKGQPALFFLVPALLMASFGTAIMRGELKEIIWYEEKEEGFNKED